MAWHKGSWWPLFVKEWYGPRCSQHMLDPYSFVILVLGLLLHLIWGTDNIGNWVFGFLAAILVELVWEIIGNSSFVLKRIKANSGTSGEYNGMKSTILDSLGSHGRGSLVLKAYDQTRFGFQNI